MTVQSLEGRLEVPASETPAAEVAQLGFSPRAIPPGNVAISERFFPNPTNEVASSSLFNIFIVSIDFAGDVYLIKRAPSDSKNFHNRMFRALTKTGDGKEVKWTFAPSEALSDRYDEPENGVSYMLAIFGTEPGKHIYFRFSV